MVEAASSTQKALDILKECEQHDILEEFAKRTPAEQEAFAEQVIHLEKVTPGGLKDYVMRARRFLIDSKNNVNPFDNYKPEVPTGVELHVGDTLLNEMEQLGLAEFEKVGFVLIAGGLGERLGYSGIKIGLPVCTIEENYTYIKFYAQYVKAVEERVLSVKKTEGFYVPLCIMVSDDTHDRTVQILEENSYFGLNKEHVQLVKQENVPALLDNDGNMALMETGEFKVITKPHGHGDIHTLLYQYGVAQKWLQSGKEWMIFFQDTNALALKTLPSVLGVSRKNNWEMNSIAVPRMPGEAMGAICKLVDQTDSSKEIVINVEYNQLDSLLKAKWNEKGDIPNEKGYSFFPGNTNTLVFKLQEYVANLERTKGVIPEFVNPKYADEARNKFKAPTRLECMMQDYPKLCQSKGSVGFTTYDTWFSFSPVKNNIKDAAALFAKGMPSFGASAGEYDFYNWTIKVLEQVAGVQIEKETDPKEYCGLKLPFGAKILLDPTFALTLDELKQKFVGTNKISKNSTLILKGSSSKVENLNLNGVLKVENGEVATGDVTTEDKVEFVPSTEADIEIFRIRGYKPSH